MMFPILANDMKKHIRIIVLFAATATAFGMYAIEFNSWDDLIEQSSDIIIARCTATIGAPVTSKPIAIMNGIIPSDIQVVSVLKGNTKPGPSCMASQYWPSRDAQFLVLANYESDQIYTGYVAIENYRIVPLNRDFQTSELSGKTLTEQVKLILSSRLKGLNDELARDNEEKQRIEAGLKNGKNSTDMSTNAPPVVPKPPLTGGRTF